MSGLGHGVTFLNALVTCSCSALSLVGSVLIILSYAIVRTQSTPKTAFLIVHLAASDFVWFLAATVLSTLWFTHGDDIPPGVCYIVSPLIIFTRMASLYWTVIISFNVYMSVLKRKWFYKNHEGWENYRWRYYWVICLFALPGTLMDMAKQYGASEKSQLGCSARYEPLGVWYEVLFTEALPILLAFIFNLYVFIAVRAKMANAPVPQSVRKKRKRVMYHYVIVCILCWIPTIVLYLLEIAGVHLPALEIVARTSLYLSGFLNFLVFGMQDPHLYRSFFVILRSAGLAGICLGAHVSSLKQSDVDKSVMFQEEALLRGMEPPKGSRRDQFLRTRKLSREDKALLYSQRPDLDPSYRVGRPKRLKSRAMVDDSAGEETVRLLDAHLAGSDSTSAASLGIAEVSTPGAEVVSSPAAPPTRYAPSPHIRRSRKAWQEDAEGGDGCGIEAADDDGGTINSLHVALLAGMVTEQAPLSSPSGAAAAATARVSMESLGDVETGEQVIMMTRQESPRDSERRISSAEAPPTGARPGSGLGLDAEALRVPDYASARSDDESSSQGAEEDLSSEDEIDEEDEALMALFPQ